MFLQNKPLMDDATPAPCHLFSVLIAKNFISLTQGPGAYIARETLAIKWRGIRSDKVLVCMLYGVDDARWPGGWWLSRNYECIDHSNNAMVTASYRVFRGWDASANNVIFLSGSDRS